jgi:formate-dependent nitrite reductase cytochrome c552 subunit
MDIFKEALKKNFRFQSNKGIVTTEDLFDLPLTQLDFMFKSLNKLSKESTEESLLSTRTQSNKDIDIKIEIIKSIVSDKLDEKQKAEARVVNKEKKELLLDVLNKKRNEALVNMSEEDILKALEEL